MSGKTVIKGFNFLIKEREKMKGYRNLFYFFIFCHGYFRKLLKMATSENEYYLRSILLLVEGGTYISKLVFYRELSKEDLDELLKRFKHKLRHELHKKQIEKLFVDHGKTNVDTWDLQMLIVVILRLFHESLLPTDRGNLRAIKQIRHEVLAHRCTATLNDVQYDDIKEQLSDALRCLAACFNQNVQKECETYIDKYALGPLDVMSARESLKQLQNNDEMFERILEKVEVCADDVRQQITDFEKNVMERLDRHGLGPCSKKIKVGMTVELTINGPNQECINFCERTLDAIFNGSEETFEELKKKKDELLDDIERNLSIKFKGSRRECVILYFECTTYTGVLDLIKYLTGRRYRQILDEITQTLAAYLRINEPVTITSRIPSSCLQGVLDYIDREDRISSTDTTTKHDRDLPERDIRPRKEYKKTLKLAMQCSSVQDLKYLWKMFQQDGARYHLDRIADALSKQAGTKITLSSSLDLQEFEEVMNDIDVKKEREEQERTYHIDRTEVTMATPSPPSPYLLVAAFDFGTTYSGYAFSLRDDPMKVQTNPVWNSGTNKLTSWKTPTCVLFTPDKQFHSFGYEAENKYLDLAEDDKHHGWLLFRRFKMLLDSNEKLSRATTVEAINGVSMPARTIFAMSIRFLKDHLMQFLNNQRIGVEDKEIKYVLTVPAIWKDNAKQFMREAAVEAGIENSQLKLALEPEAASIWCQTVTTDVDFSKAGTQYMVVDLGGGTADVTVHEKQTDGTLKELHQSSGGSWGGNVVDNNYLEWLTKVFGELTMKRFKEEEMGDYFKILRDFETEKRNIRADTSGKKIFRVSVSLKEIYQQLEKVPLNDKAAALGLGEKLTFVGDKFRVDASIIKECFAAPVQNMISHVKDVLAEPKMQNVNTILLVGGFGESELVQDEMKRNIKKQRIIIPTEAGLVVLKGAVRFGHIPDIVSSRIMPFTYGVAVVEAFIDFKHPMSKLVTINNKNYADNVFSIFVRVGEEVKARKHIFSPNYIPTCLPQTSLYIYQSIKSDPEYTTDGGCKELGKMTIVHPEGDTFEDKKFDVTFVFGDTELLVKANMQKTGQEFTIYVDFLN